MSEIGKHSEVHEIDERFLIIRRSDDGGIRLTPQPEFIDPDTGINTIRQTPEGEARYQDLSKDLQVIHVHGG
jgi:hypothetical protein